MIKITENSKLYIWGSPSYVRSGGAEVLNLLASNLKHKGVNVSMFNWEENGHYKQGDYYAKYYDVNIIDWNDIKDGEDTIILFPEIILEYENIMMDLFRDFKKSQFIFWWLSSSFLYGYDVKTSKRLQFQYLKYFKDRCLHACESEVTFRDCLYYGAENRILLQHGLNEIFYNLPKQGEKKDIVFYNAFKPKTKNYVEQNLKPFMPDINFIELHYENGKEFKTKEEMCGIFDECKVYVDFCGFEGRELMPREACVRDCILILGDEGNAATFDDYPIDKWYKVDVTDDSKIIQNKIRTAIEEYDTRIMDMNFFKNKCLYEPMKWEWELYNIFGPMIKK